MTIRTWGIGGQAQDDEGSARLLAHFAVGGRVGVLGPLDCRVLPLTTPGPGFRVAVGAFVNPIASKARQKYVGEIDAEEQVTGLAGTGSSGGRHDLVCLRTNNPLLPGGGNAPADPLLGSYSYLEVITGVPLGTKRFSDLGFLYSAQALARIEYPASTATIGGGTGNAKIVDLRASATGADAESGGTTDADPVPGTDPVSTPPAAASQNFYDFHAPPPAGPPFSDIASLNWGVWPSLPAGLATFAVDVPTYARSMVVKAVADNVAAAVGDIEGDFAVVEGLGGTTVASRFFRQEWAGGQSTVRLVSAALVPVPVAMRGKRVNFTTWARRRAGAGYLRFYPGISFVELDIRFRA